MKAFTPSLLALQVGFLIASSAHALPPTTAGSSSQRRHLLDSSQQLRQAATESPQTVTLLFQAGPAGYNLTLPADGQAYPTGNDELAVNLIVSPDYDPYRYCTFTTAAQAQAGAGAGDSQQPGETVTLAPSLVQRDGVDAWPVNEIAVGPPQPIVSVSCSGFCLGVYGELPFFIFLPRLNMQSFFFFFFFPLSFFFLEVNFQNDSDG